MLLADGPCVVQTPAKRSVAYIKANGSRAASLRAIGAKADKIEFVMC